MKIFTQSPVAREAQKGVMEFLLINHPLDCPICDQGGECELQDLAMGYGRNVSRYTENKRVVADEDIGPLVSTDMTRCIHCTRCVRFGEEIAGMPELGATGRGEHMRIGTYVKKAMVSELSGNVIDLCPVGALNNKPYRFAARAWELTQHANVGQHDCVGSNLYLHTLRNKVRRAVPRDNEALNENWLSDRDRFSCHAINSPQRLERPLLKVGNDWRSVSWDDALREVGACLQPVLNDHGPDALGALISANSTVEECYLMQKLVRGLGSRNIDHRLRQYDFSADREAPVMPWLGREIQGLEQVDAALLIGSNVRKDQPMAALRLRKAALNGAALMFVNHRRYDFHFPVAGQIAGGAQEMVPNLAAIAKALCELTGKSMPLSMQNWIEGVSPSDEHRHMAERLRQAGNGAVILGSQAPLLPDYAAIQALAYAIAKVSGASFGYLSDGANAAGAWLAGAVPHRGPGGAPLPAEGLTARGMLESPRRAYLLFNTEPELDGWDPALARQALNAAQAVIAISAFDSPGLRAYADIILPLAAFGETSGTFVNAEGLWQSFQGAVSPRGEARPGWKILRVLGNTFDLSGFDYFSSEEVRQELQHQCAERVLNNDLKSAPATGRETGNRSPLTRIADIPIYAGDALSRHSEPLQQTNDAQRGRQFAVNSATAGKLGLSDAQTVAVRQADETVQFVLHIDDGIPDDCVYIGLGVPGSERLGPAFGPVEVKGL
jgi:NADH-quinone oxidoreductase subunit G